MYIFFEVLGGWKKTPRGNKSDVSGAISGLYKKKTSDVYTPGASNIAGWKMNPCKMYFLLNMVIFQPAMLVYQRVN